jgi:outer membrane protein OmpA-like peptidoglycan-associated protein
MTGSAWAAAPAAGENAHGSKAVTAGFGSGAAIGAAAGGPLGAILGAAFGGWLGGRFQHEKELRVAAEADSAQSHAQAAALQSRLDGREQELEKVEATLMAERQANRTALEQAINLSVYFRTGKSDLDPSSAERLARIARLLTPMQGVVVQLDGFADKRGADEYNEQLSAARAEAVRQAFLAAGFPQERISVTAEGERLAKADDLDAMAMERRVQISIDNGAGTAERVAQK